MRRGKGAGEWKAQRRCCCAVPAPSAPCSGSSDPDGVGHARPYSSMWKAVVNAARATAAGAGVGVAFYYWNSTLLEVPCSRSDGARARGARERERQVEAHRGPSAQRRAPQTRTQDSHVHLTEMATRLERLSDMTPRSPPPPPAQVREPRGLRAQPFPPHLNLSRPAPCPEPHAAPTPY